MILEIHSRVALKYKPLRGLDLMIRWGDKYFAISRNIPWDLDSFMARVSDFKQKRVLGHYIRSWKGK